MEANNIGSETLRQKSSIQKSFQSKLLSHLSNIKTLFSSWILLCLSGLLELGMVSLPSTEIVVFTWGAHGLLHIGFTSADKDEHSQITYIEALIMKQPNLGYADVKLFFQCIVLAVPGVYLYVNPTISMPPSYLRGPIF